MNYLIGWNHYKMFAWNFNYIKNILLLAALLVPNPYLPFLLMLMIIYDVQLDIDLKRIGVLIYGLIATLISLVALNSDVRYLLPFVFLYFVLGANSLKTKLHENKLVMKTILVWLIIVIASAVLSVVIGPEVFDSYLSLYKTQDIDQFSYSFDDFSVYRSGSIYLNPNQLAYIAILILIFGGKVGLSFRMQLIVSVLVIILTQSRALLLIASIFTCYSIFRRDVGSYKLTLIVVLLLFFVGVGLYSTLDYRTIDARIFQTSNNVSDALYKINIIGEISELNFYEIIFGAGYNRGIHFDADVGSLLYYYGLVVGPAMLIAFSIFIYFNYGSSAAIAFLAAISYGTIVTNTRMVVVSCALIMLSYNRESKKNDCFG